MERMAQRRDNQGRLALGDSALGSEAVETHLEDSRIRHH